MICKKCGIDNPSGSKFCCGCGEKLALLCPSCHSEVPAGAKFCLMCGTGLGGSPAPGQVQRGGILNDAVVAGDVSLSSTNYINNITAKQSIYCHACGKKLNEGIDEIYKCAGCGEFYCSAHYNVLQRMCNDCSKSNTAATADKQGKDNIRSVLDACADLIYAGDFKRAEAQLNKLQSEYEDAGKIIGVSGFYWCMLMVQQCATDNDALAKAFVKSGKDLSRDVNYRMAVRKANEYEKETYEAVLGKVTAAQSEASKKARLAEEARKAEEARLAEEARKAEEARLAEEKRKAEEARLNEEKRRAEIASMAAAAAARSEPGVKFSDDGMTLLGYSANKPNKTYSIPYGVTRIDKEAFYKCKNLTSVIIPDTVTEIGPFAFYECENLMDLRIPAGVVKIDSFAFAHCYKLRSVTFADSMESEAAVGSSPTQSRLEKICINAFYLCETLTSVTIPSSVKSIHAFAFMSCKRLKEINVSEANKKFCSIDGVLYSKRKTTLHCYPAGKSGTTYSIPSGVTHIGDVAFGSCEALRSISVPSSVTKIGGMAFYNCSSLTKVNIPSTVTAIEEHTFNGCSSLSDITIPSSVTRIGNNAFQKCTSLASIAIPSSITSIGNLAFTECASLTSISIPSSVTQVGHLAFCDCKALTSVSIAGSRITIGDSAFLRCERLTGVQIPPNAILGKDVFKSCPYQMYK